MARSNKPLVWSLFAAGGTVAAFILPVLVLLMLMAGHGNTPAGLSYETLRPFAAHWLGKLILFSVIGCLWHGRANPR